MGTDLANYCPEFDLICLIFFLNKTTQVDEPKMISFWIACCKKLYYVNTEGKSMLNGDPA